MTRLSRRRRPLFQRRTPPGASPGSLVADPTAPKPEIKVIAYGPENVVERELHTLADLKQIEPLMAAYPVTWVNVDGLGDAEVIRRLGEMFHLHPLAMEETFVDLVVSCCHPKVAAKIENRQSLNDFGNEREA